MKRMSKLKILLWKLLGLNPYSIKPKGYCPVQAEGVLSDGKFYYFRARGTNISLGIGDTEDGAIDDTIFYRELPYGTDFEAGYLTEENSIKLSTFWIDEYFLLKLNFNS